MDIQKTWGNCAVAVFAIKSSQSAFSACTNNGEAYSRLWNGTRILSTCIRTLFLIPHLNADDCCVVVYNNLHTTCMPLLIFIFFLLSWSILSLCFLYASYMFRSLYLPPSLSDSLTHLLNLNENVYVARIFLSLHAMKFCMFISL